MLSYQTVEPHTLELLRSIMARPMFNDMRLVGGTALALQYAHRKSVDLDFFGGMPNDADEMAEELSGIGSLQIVKSSARIRIYYIDKIKVDFVDYSRYPWIDEPVIDDGLRIASPQDIAAMKVNAIEGRGTRKDFVDIYFLLQHFTLPQIVGFYKQKYPEYSEFRALMSLTYFDDAEEQMMPNMLKGVDWETMKAKIIEAVDAYDG